MAAAGHGNGNANANGDSDARSTGATGRRLVLLRLSTYLPQPPSTVNLSSASSLLPTRYSTPIAVAFAIAHPAGASPVLQR
jgi:hypothetical protein